MAHDESWSENYGAGGVQNGPNIPFAVSVEDEQVVFTYDPVTHVLDIGTDGPKGNITEARAYWLAEDVLAWNVPDGSNVSLHYSADASLALSVDGVVGGDSITLARDGPQIACWQ